MKSFKIILGALLIFGAIQELVSIIKTTETVEDWPFGAEIGFVIMVALAIWLIKSGLNKRSSNQKGKIISD